MTKEAAVLNAYSAENSSSAMMKVAREIPAAPDRNAAAGGGEHTALVTWTMVMALATVVLRVLTIRLARHRRWSHLSPASLQVANR